MTPLDAMVDAMAAPEPRPRLRNLFGTHGVEPGVLPTGPLNAITDVDGVLVGHRTLIRGDSVRTGVTAALTEKRGVSNTF